MLSKSIFYKFFLSLKQYFLKGKTSRKIPIVWAPPKITQEPSTSFKNTLSEDDIQRLDRIFKEARLISQIYKYVPTNLSENDWSSLLKCESPKQRLSQLRFFYEKLRKREKEELEKKLKLSEEEENLIENEDNVNRNCGLILNSKRTKRIKLEQQALNHIHSFFLDSPPRIAIDCRFLPLHSQRGMNLTTIQLLLLISNNMDRRNPWPLFLVNFDEMDTDVQEMKKKHLNILFSQNRHLITLPEITQKNYLDLFPREEIIYLSPDAEDSLEKIDSEKVYIIGGIVDRVKEPKISDHASLETALSEGVESRKLPLDTYINWKSGNKYLTLTSVLQILQDVYETQGNWKLAFERNIPVRKVRSVDEKNPRVREKYKEYHRYEKEVLRIVEENMGDKNI